MSRSVLRVAYEFPFRVIGIVSSVREYRVCNAVNKMLDLEFYREEDLEMVMNRQGDDAHFALFRHSESGTEKYFLIGNRGSTAWFFPEIKNVDYLLIVHDPGNFFDQEAALQKLRAIDLVTGAYPIDYEKFKSRENLLFLN